MRAGTRTGTGAFLECENRLYNEAVLLPAMRNHLFALTIVSYSASLGGYVAFLASARRLFGRLGTLFLITGLGCHYLALLERSRWAHTVPYNDLYGSLSLFAWLLAVTYLGLELFHRDRSVGAFVLPFVIAVFSVAQVTSTAKIGRASCRERVCLYV